MVAISARSLILSMYFNWYRKLEKVNKHTSFLMRMSLLICIRSRFLSSILCINSCKLRSLRLPTPSLLFRHGIRCLAFRNSFNMASYLEMLDESCFRICSKSLKLAPYSTCPTGKFWLFKPDSSSFAASFVGSVFLLIWILVAPFWFYYKVWKLWVA